MVDNKTCRKCPRRLQYPNNCSEPIKTEWIDGYFTKECPVLSRVEYDFLFSLWVDHRNSGNWPNKGGLMYQSPKIVEVFKIINNTIEDIKEARAG